MKQDKLILFDIDGIIFKIDYLVDKAFRAMTKKRKYVVCVF
jgi:hypothetical protein